MSRPDGPVRRPAGAVWVEGITSNGMTGLAVDRYGKVGSRACQVCEHRLDDVDGLGTHPLCDPDGQVAARLIQDTDDDADGAW